MRAAGQLGSIGRVASNADNTMMESLGSTVQRELLDHRQWSTRAQLGSANLEWIAGFYKPRRRRFGLGCRSAAEFEALHTAALTAA